MTRTAVPPWIASVDTMREERSVPGIAIAIRVAGALVSNVALGHRDLEGELPLEADAHFPAYSMTKTMTAVVALKLAESGRLDLDAPLDRWHPDLPLSSRVTLRRLLNHSAGIPNYSGVPSQIRALANSPGRAWSREEFTREVCHRAPDFDPGTGWAYSNTGYFLLRLVLEEVGEDPLGKLIDQHVCQPLALERTFAWTDFESGKRLTPGFSGQWQEGDGLADVRSLYDPGWCATGVMASTASELCLFFEALFEGSLLSADARAQMLELLPVPQTHPGASPHYGLGLMALLHGPLGSEYGHGGGGPGYNVHASHFPSLSGAPTTISVLCNRDEDHAWLLLHEIAERCGESAR